MTALTFGSLLPQDGICQKDAFTANSPILALKMDILMTKTPLTVYKFYIIRNQAGIYLII
jgi:hypothetical protein